jgi:epidermal growth factor receptor kinase substrate 8
MLTTQDRSDYGRQLGNRPRTLAIYQVNTPAENGVNHDVIDDDATYHLDHLATYTISPNRGMSTPNDAIARLRHMADTCGIWTKRLRLRVGARDLVLVDGDEPIERFPLRLVTDAVCETSQLDAYKNVVVITVAGDDMMGARRRIPPSEMHLFHCLARPGHHLVDDILTAKSGQPLHRHGNIKQQVYEQHTYAIPNRNYINSPVTSSSANSLSSFQHLTAEDKKTINLKVLDACFGDIERFVTKLQTAAKEQQQTTEGGNSKSDEVKPPAAKEFFDIFQKIKLCFILLAHLKNEINNPDVYELTRELFTPLTLAVSASRDPDTNQAQLAKQVISPLLTADAVELLNSSLTSQEMETLRLLGTAWITPRSRWTEAIPPFHPHFASGYHPPPSWLNDVLSDSVHVLPNGHDIVRQSSQDSTMTPAGDSSSQLSESINAGFPDVQGQQPRNEDIKRKLARDYTRRQELEWKRAQQQRQLMLQQQQLSGDMSPRSNSAALTTTDRLQQDFLRQLRARNARICVVTKQRNANNFQELNLEANEILEVIENTKNWWKVANFRGESGFAPHNILQMI